MPLVDVSKLNQALTTYDKALRALPYVALKNVGAALGLNVMNLQGKHALVNERRRAGGTQSYKIGKTFKNLDNILGYDSSVIEPKDTVFITKENSQKYNDNELLVVGGKPVDNVTKKHPFELKIASKMVISHAEDIVFSMCHGSYDDNSTSPMGAIDGFFTKIDKLIVANAVNAACGNYAVSGMFEMPKSETDFAAYENLVEWLAGAHPMLRSSQGGIPQLIAAQSVLIAARSALRNKLRMQEYPTMQRMIECLREDAFIPQLEVVTHECLGTGSRLVLQKKGNWDIAFNTQAASKFCQIRDIYEDPNEWQFWLQAGYDTRVRDWHEKVFRTNEQKNDALDLSGDYCNTGGVLVNLTNDDGKGTFSIKGKTGSRMSGQYIIGLTPGQHTLTFGEVATKNKPIDKQITIKAGQVIEEQGAYT